MTTSTQRPPINPRMLVWARERCGKTLEEVAQKFPHIESWERLGERPTVKQARNLAEYYQRSFLEFFRDEPPVISDPEAIPDFRMERGFSTAAENYELRQLQVWAEAKRINALDLLEELGEVVPEVPPDLFASIDDDVEDVSVRVRREIDFSANDQVSISASAADKLPEIIREKFEKFGILVLRNSDLKHVHARGLCIAHFPLPVIVYASEFPGAQAFTIAHEFAHILLKQSGVVGFESRAQASAVENWCNRFAAAFLMPKSEIAGFLGERPEGGGGRFDDALLDSVATHFRVSKHAMLIRLMHLGYASASFYWDEKKPQFDREESEYRSFGRAPYYGSRYKNSLGTFYTSLVIDAWNAGKITNHSAAEYMGIKNLSHLFDIRSHLLG